MGICPMLPKTYRAGAVGWMACGVLFYVAERSHTNEGDRTRPGINTGQGLCPQSKLAWFYRNSLHR